MKSSATEADRVASPVPFARSKRTAPAANTALAPAPLTENEPGVTGLGEKYRGSRTGS